MVGIFFIIAKTQTGSSIKIAINSMVKTIKGTDL